MTTSKKIETWQGATEAHRFTVDFFEDGEQGLFRAVLRAHTPLLANDLRLPGQAPARVSEEEPLRLKPEEDLDVLKGIVKATIRVRYGEILKLRD